jgi:hypothetical protein
MAEKLLRDKLGYTEGHTVLLVGLPAEVADPFEGVVHDVARAGTAKFGKRKFDLVMAFTRDQAALGAVAGAVLAVLVDDPKLWLAYPKKTGDIATDLTRDAGWAPMLDAGFIVVSIVSVDATWSAVRFRPIHLVKSTRR